MKRFLLLEWVGWWVVATRNGEPAPLFEAVTEAQEWVRKLYCRGPYGEEFERVWPRFKAVELELPDGPGTEDELW